MCLDRSIGSSSKNCSQEKTGNIFLGEKIVLKADLAVQ